MSEELRGAAEVAAAEAVEVAAEVAVKASEAEVEADDGWDVATGRDIAALLDPRPTLIVAAPGARRACGFATIIWAMPVSHKPPMVAIALRDSAHTMECIEINSCFSLNVLPATDQALHLAQVCGTRSGRKMDKRPLVPHHRVDVEFERTEQRRVQVRKAGLFSAAKYEMQEETQLVKASVPVVDCASSYLLCAVDHFEPCGDHMLIVGKVLEAKTKAPRNDDGLLEPEDVLLCIQHTAFGRVAPLDYAAKPKGPGAKAPMAPPKMAPGVGAAVAAAARAAAAGTDAAADAAAGTGAGQAGLAEV